MKSLPALLVSAAPSDSASPSRPATGSRSPLSCVLMLAAAILVLLPAQAQAQAQANMSTGTANVQAASSARQDHYALRQLVQNFLATQAAGVPGQVVVHVGAIDPRLSLAACPAPQVFLPNGSRAWGKTTAGVRCMAPTPWSIYLSAQVQVQGEYYVAATPLAQGQVLQANDLAPVQGDLGQLPAGIITDPAQAIGQALTRSLALGAPLRQDLLKSQQVVSQGQVVRLVGSGNGFRVSAAGRALANASEGQVVQARAGNGQVVSGIARASGVIEVTF